MSNDLIVRGARVHDLKNIDVVIPRNSIVVITGPSGSGKTSLAIDTIHAEAKRRYMSAVSGAETWDSFVPLVDYVEGLSPTIALGRQNPLTMSRTSVAAVTGLMEPLRILYGRFALPWCISCDQVVKIHSAGQVTNSMLEKMEGSQITIRAPISISHGSVDMLQKMLRDSRFSRALIDGKVYRIDEYEPSAFPEAVEIIVDRCSIHKNERARILDAVENSFMLSGGYVVIQDEEGSVERFSNLSKCMICGADVISPAPQYLSSRGAGKCTVCEGTGESNPSSSVTIERDDDFEEIERTTSSYAPCRFCDGTRLHPSVLAWRLADVSLHHVFTTSVSQLRIDLSKIIVFDSTQIVIEPLLKRIVERLKFLDEVGVGHLTLGRTISTLSSGEIKRTLLASCLSDSLTGVMYILDEPTAGLPPKDFEYVWKTLRSLIDRGNSLLLIEHQPEAIMRADYIIELGQGAGPLGGKIVATGSLDKILSQPDSLTGAYISKKRQFPVLQPVKDRGQLVVHYAQGVVLNVKDIKIPIGQLTCITGSSGSGKSEFAIGAIYEGLRYKLRGHLLPSVQVKIEGAETIRRVVCVDNLPLARSRRSTIVSYMDILKPIRELFASLPESRVRGWKANRFSTHIRGGRCEQCLGLGQISIGEQWFSDLEILCDRCRGTGFDETTLEVRYRGHDIATVMQMRVDEAFLFFEAQPKVRNKLAALMRTGLQYLSLHRKTYSLSGGEIQRMRLAKAMFQEIDNTLYVFDEPTKGLHFVDIENLIHAFDELLQRGNTLVIVENRKDMIALCHHMIDLDSNN